MKKNKHIFTKSSLFNAGKVIWSALFLTTVLISGCEETDEDITPPGEVSNITIEGQHGGAIISYQIPDDEDFHLLKAVYTNSLGNEVFRVASYYNSSIEVEGFNDTENHNVTLYTVDRKNNVSDGIEVQITPLISHIHLVKENISLSPDLGGVNVTWENTTGKQVFVYLYYEADGIEEYRILSSKSINESFTERGLDSISYDFSVLVEDFDGNKTDKVFKASIKPLFEEKIDKSTWDLLQSLSVDGDKWEGVLANFFDDVVDTKESPSDNSYFIINRDDNGGTLHFPLDVVIDMNKQVILNRFTVWQRAFWYRSQEDNGISVDYYYYQGENMRSFDLWASNDKLEWWLLGNYDIGDPKDEDGNVPANKISEALDGHEFFLDAISDPFRYLKFSITSGYGSETNVYGSEITLFGLDNVTE